MTLSASSIVLIAKQRQIEELRYLAARADLVAAIGQLVHALQSERGASSIFLASAGTQFASQRVALANQGKAAESQLRDMIGLRLNEPAFGTATLCSLMAWVVLGLDTLPALRDKISTHEITADEAVIAFSRLIAGLLSLIFHVADASVDPGISRHLVALFNLIQGKELAGQERAVGAGLFASGRATVQHQQRVLHLIDAQERNIQLFCEFADPAMVAEWRSMQSAAFMVQLERLRRILCTSPAGTQLDARQSGDWFECCTERLTGMWHLQNALVDELRERCATLIAEAEQDRADTAGMLEDVAKHPPESTRLVERFLGPEAVLDGALGILPARAGGGSENSLLHVLQAQTARLATMERELDSARRALQERKSIERAKGVLMARFDMSEEEAYKTLRKTSMEQNRRIAEVAEATLSVLSAIGPASP